MAETNPSYSSRVLGCALGCLRGGAIGDAFGYEVEFLRLPAIRKRFGPAGLTEPVRHDGKLIVSDDTQMTLFTLEGLLRARSAGCLGGKGNDLDATLEHIRLATLDWHLTQSAGAAHARYTGALGRSRVLQVRRAPGNTCLSACALGAHGSPGHPVNDSKGCGGVMRVAPIGLMRELTPAQAFELGMRAAAQTHGHPEGYLPAGALAAIVRVLVAGQSLAQAVSAASEILQRTPRSSRTLDALQAAQGESLAGLGEGWVGEEALAIGLHAAVVGKDFAGALRIAANHDGDSDSTASIAGQILGAALGAGALPAGWAEGLDCAAELTELARQLAGEALQA